MVSELLTAILPDLVVIPCVVIPRRRYDLARAYGLSIGCDGPWLSEEVRILPLAQAVRATPLRSVTERVLVLSRLR
jgi:hypothetical protein